MPQVYWRSCPQLRYTAPFLLSPPPPSPQRLRIGFASSFLYHHSVGLLLQGVMTRLDPRRYEVFALCVPPLPSLSDPVFQHIASTVEHTLLLPRTLPAAQEAIAELRLDVLIFGEAGMDALTYFLAFGQLARRSALFWGHAVTSGIPSALGGPDYFISSPLFEPQDLGSQARYSESLYLMQGLTTYFLPPPTPPLPPPAFLSSLGLDGPATGQPLYLLPQTLYKLHPSMDPMLRDLLLLDPSATLALPRAHVDAWSTALLQRLTAVMGEEMVRRQVVLFRRLEYEEYAALAQAATLVLDPFPVGGGRSSFEILAQGRYNRLHI
jgi:predicted O-linked N-acetylglucosamine transferase (SPINDLY family)